ncbi:MAG: Arm DNA-binding domain-containing protein [Mesorhizobium sp.]
MNQKIKLTKRAVDGAEVRSSRYVLFDSEIKGFGLRVFPSGQKSWIFEYKVDGGGRKASTKRVTIGRSDEFTPDEARKFAEKLRAKAKMGLDPQAEKVEYRKAVTVDELADKFLVHIGSKKKDRTEAFYRDVLKRLVISELGNRKAADLKRADLAKLHLDLNNRPYLANRVVAVVGSMYSFAGKHGLVPENCNPARGIEKFEERSRERLLSADELVRLGDAIRVAETEGIPWQINPAKKTKHVPKKAGSCHRPARRCCASIANLYRCSPAGNSASGMVSTSIWSAGCCSCRHRRQARKPSCSMRPQSRLLNLDRLGKYVIAGKTAGLEDEKPRADLKRPWAMVTRHADGRPAHS